MIVEIPVLKVVIIITSFACVRLALLSRTVLIDVLNLIYYSLEFVTCLILGHFRLFFEGAHQFWASVLRGWAGGRQGRGVWREVATAVKKTVQRSSTVKTRTPEQSI